jgi:hypothetical protein
MSGAHSDSDVFITEILTPKSRKSLKRTCGIREHGKDGRDKSARKHFKFFGFRTSQKSHDVSWLRAPARLLLFFVAHSMDSYREVRPDYRQGFDPGGVRRFDT